MLVSSIEMAANTGKKRTIQSKVHAAVKERKKCYIMQTN